MIGKLEAVIINETQVRVFTGGGTILRREAGLLTFSSKWDAQEFAELIKSVDPVRARSGQTPDQPAAR